MELNKIYQGDCLVESENIESGSVDLILTDLPYGNMYTTGLEITQNKKQRKHNWDLAIEPKRIYEIANKILRKNGKIILFSQEPYTSQLIIQTHANIPFSYRAIWEKDNFAVSLGVNRNMVSYFEDILVFSKSGSGENNKTKEYLIKEKEKAYKGGWTDKTLRVLCNVSLRGGGLLCHYWGVGQWMMPTEKIYNRLQKTGFFKKDYKELKRINEKYESTFNLWEGKKYKGNILKYKKDYDGFHPTQKPVLLLEDLIKTFSNEGDLVVDLTAGSGTIAIACMQTNRNFIGMELEPKYVEIANNRIANSIPSFLY